MTEEYRRCPHCRGTGICRHCNGTGRLALQKGKQCTSCYPHGSGKCQNCRGLGWFDHTGKPASAPEELKAGESSAAQAEAGAAVPPADEAAPAPEVKPRIRKPSAKKTRSAG